MHDCRHFLVALALLMVLPAWAAKCETPDRLRFSLVPQDDVHKDIAALQPLFQALQAALGIPVEVVLPKSYGFVVEGLLAGAIDLAKLGPAAYLSAKNADPGITAFASTANKAAAFQNEGASYSSLLIVRKGGPFTSIRSLRGKRIALVDPDSTSGALIPRLAFARLTGGQLEAYFGRVAYTGSHDRSALTVLDEQVDAAFVSSSLLSSLVAAGKAQQEDFAVLWRSSPIPRNPFVYRSQLCAGVTEKIRAVFLKQDGKSNKALLDNLKAVRFVPISDSDYQILRDLP